MKPDLPQSWPQRPSRFYDDWAIFCVEVLSALIKNRQGAERLADILLAGGAVLGEDTMFALIQTHRGLLDEQGREWGVKELSTLATVLGSFGGALVTRVLSRHAETARVSALQASLAAARREFKTLLQDRDSGGIDQNVHRGAVERLFWVLTQDR
jgi:hypothetical protein